jgi:perosamine synthetase
MKSFLRPISVIASFAATQVVNVANLACGRLVNPPALGSMTLEPDDSAIARRLLRAKKDWRSIEPTLEFQRQFCTWNGSRHGFAFMSGREALSAIIAAVELKPGDGVIIPGYTCVVVPNAFHYAGINVTYADIELDTWGMDADDFARKLNSSTKAVLLHHLYGIVSRDYEKIVEIAHAKGLRIIEDCAQSTGAEYNGKKVGRLGDAAFYSSEQSKIFNTTTGGIAVTDDERIAERLNNLHANAPFPSDDRIEACLRTVTANYHSFKHPQRWWRRDFIKIVGRGRHRVISTTAGEEAAIKPPQYGCKLPGAISYVAINQLAKIERFNERRRATAKRWDTWCETSGYRKPLIIQHSTPSFLRYPVMVEPERKLNREWALRELGVELGVWFAGQLHPTRRPVSGCMSSEKAVLQCVNLPTLLA